MRLHDLLYGSDLHRVFHNWWQYARANYLPFKAGLSGDTLTLYYDPLINYHHRVGPGGGLPLSFQLLPQKRDEARLLFEAAADSVGWRDLEPVRESSKDWTSLQDTPRNTLLGLAIARELGDDAVYAKLKAHAETHYEPTWDPGTGEFTWGFGLREPHPRGQYNAVMMISEAGSEGAWWRLVHEPNLRKFIDPTVHSVDFPTVCLSQAWYDVDRRCLVVSTDAGAPGAAGQRTAFRVSNVDPQRCRVTIDGRPSDDWHAVNGDLEIATTVGEHTVCIRH